MRILLLTENKQDATSFYRGAGIVSDLAQKSKAVIDILNWDELKPDWSIFALYDLVYMQRPLTTEAVNSAIYLKMMGKRLWIDWDDDYLNIPVYHFFVLQLQSYRDNVIKLAGMADIITVTTNALHSVYSQFNSNIRVIPNAIPSMLLNKCKYDNSGGVFWRGSHLHFPNVMHYANELQEVINQGIKIKFQGLNPFFLNAYTMLPEMEMYNYLEHYKKISPKFSFVCLIDNEFNRGRSNIAWIEATMAGTVCLAPDWEEWQKPGIVNYSNREEFVSKFAEMYNADLKQHYEMSYDYISENLILENVNKLRLEIL
ncbi:MAG TPA: hypothetical protein DHV48_03645 [Prolixibacteraceae bacterium]|nr:hypothetical protein [Prolixibacteraceae bacterium]